MRRERRLHQRHAVAFELTGSSLEAMQPYDGATPARWELHGRVLDLGGGGLCLLTDEEVEVAVPFLCRILAPGMPIGIPTLLQVRWAKQPENGQLYRLGLQFMM
jgi:hypothetical protein